MISIKKDNDYVKELLKCEEGMQLDFKQGITNQLKIAKTIAAFANTKGGQIIIGISDRKQIIGIDVDEEIFMVEEAIRKYITPPISPIFEIYEIDYIEEEKLKEELLILIVNIPESQLKPHAVNGGDLNSIYYMREGDRSMPFVNPDTL
jgi:predicted HTH transcriptional regulator